MIVREVEQKITGNILILSCTEGRDGYEVRMYEENEIDGFLKSRVEYRNGEELYVYDISGYENLSDRYGHTSIRINDLKTLFRDISSAFMMTERYILSPEHLRLEPENIYYGSKDKRFYICFYPKEEGELKTTLETLADFIIQNTDYNNEDAIRLAYEFYKNVTMGSFIIPDCSDVKETENKDNESINNKNIYKSEAGYCSERAAYREYERERSTDAGSKSCCEDKDKEISGGEEAKGIGVSLVICGIIMTLITVFLLVAVICSPSEINRLLEKNGVLGGIAIAASLCTVIPLMKLGHGNKIQK
ncbi:MAG: DUF6382 domain-containing protein [Lachnospiraceae bacterium]|nr:DUF6382 domain-containing protein [Lachnospiraceae bacterium]